VYAIAVASGNAVKLRVHSEFTYSIQWLASSTCHCPPTLPKKWFWINVKLIADRREEDLALEKSQCSEDGRWVP
jgi:hypothetical protein